LAELERVGFIRKEGSEWGGNLVLDNDERLAWASDVVWAEVRGSARIARELSRETRALSGLLFSVWRLCDGTKTVPEIVSQVVENCSNEIEAYLRRFLPDLDEEDQDLRAATVKLVLRFLKASHLVEASENTDRDKAPYKEADRL